MAKTFKQISYIHKKLTMAYRHCPSVEIIDDIDITSPWPAQAWMLTVLVSRKLAIQIQQLEPGRKSSVKITIETADAFGMQISKQSVTFASPVDALNEVCNRIDLRRFQNHSKIRP